MKRLKHILKQKIKIHFALLVLMYCLFAVCTLFYGRVFSFEEWLQIALYYGILVVILFIINLNNKRWIKWVIFGGFFFFPLSYLILTAADLPDITSLDLLLTSAPASVPFLPEKLNYPSQNQSIITIIFYFLYFILPIIYWYGLYILSKRIIKSKS